MNIIHDSYATYVCYHLPTYNMKVFRKNNLYTKCQVKLTFNSNKHKNCIIYIYWKLLEKKNVKYVHVKT